MSLKMPDVDEGIRLPATQGQNAISLSVDRDVLNDTITIEDVTYAGELFRALGLGPVGTWLRIERREDGVLTVFQVSAGTSPSAEMDRLNNRGAWLTESKGGVWIQESK